MDSLVHMVSWLLIAKYLVYTKVQYQAKRYFSKGEPLSVDGSKVLFQNHSSLLCHSPMGTCQRFQISPYLPMTSQITLSLLGDMTQVAEHSTQQSGTVEESSPVPDLSQN